MRSGAAGLVVGHPLDTVKVRLQTMRYSGLIDCVRLTLRQETVPYVVICSSAFETTYGTYPLM